MKAAKNTFIIPFTLGAVYLIFLICIGCKADAQKPMNKFLSEPLHIDKKGEITISINNKNWPYKEKLGNELLLVSLIFKDSSSSSMRPDYYFKSKLIFELSAFSKYQDTILNRLTLSEYVSATNKIILKSAKESGGGRGIENYNTGYIIGIVTNFAYEDLTIKLNILEGDSLLNTLSPRIVIEDFKSSPEVSGY